MPANPAPAYQSPALANEPLLLRTLARVCQQHGITDASTYQLLHTVVADIRHLTYRQKITTALQDYDDSDDPDVDTLDILTEFASNVIATEDCRPGVQASAAELAPSIRDAITTIVSELWDREKRDYHQQNPEDRDGHPFNALALLHGWLGPFSTVN